MPPRRVRRVLTDAECVQWGLEELDAWPEMLREPLKDHRAGEVLGYWMKCTWEDFAAAIGESAPSILKHNPDGRIKVSAMPWGLDHWPWKPASWTIRRGYISFRLRPDVPGGPDGAGQVDYHTQLMRDIWKGGRPDQVHEWVVHHVNENELDNDWDNIVWTTKPWHDLFHSKDGGRPRVHRKMQWSAPRVRPRLN
jgi:hypothetical protein